MREGRGFRKWVRSLCLKLDSSFCPSAVDCEGRTIWIADAHRDDGKRFVVHADEKLTAFLELERAVCIHVFSEA